ncbi:MAG: flavodoxin-dependent (E)-4-hydroxy-3-methylbut-2-enyl-diphosphate synthase [Candidatus Eremiobacteraeota bacterium]|nr:flavodoxin-dependent (E)-4-hydroxy-3-methylbut-2-enyl-diphosphate synthase [Candidatus Eremiobacteraeota bacterium]
MIKRRKTHKIKIRNIYIGGDAPVAVQSMTNTATKDVEATLKQIKRLEEAGCELVRVGVPDMESAKALGKIISGTDLPVAADIHFDAKLAHEAISQGVHKLRINPGNLRNRDEVKSLAKQANSAGIPIRIGVNAGSLDPMLYKKYEGICAEAMVESADREIVLLNKVGFDNIIISLKASSVPICVEAYRLMSQLCDYPMHIGITEAGTRNFGTIKSSVGLGILLYEGIGDTLRVSLTDDPVQEIRVAWDILKSLEIRQRGPELISCPTCARTQIDVVRIACEVEERVRNIPYPLKLAVMGCVVNGPGEAKEADLGIAGGKGKGVIFKEGKKLRVVDEENLLDSFMDEVGKLVEEMRNIASKEIRE